MNSLLIDKNEIDLFTQFMGDELFIINDITWYDNPESEGENNFKFLNIFDFDNTESIPSEFRETFIEVISEIKKGDNIMDINGQVAINLNNSPNISLKNILEKFSPRAICFWGVEPSKLGLNIGVMKGLVYDKIRILNLETPEKIMQDEQLKQKCISYILNMFGIKK